MFGLVDYKIDLGE